ncbi:MAG TPA: fumarylacetoacetate hydrolase family protein [Acidimicrobiia bacterium]|nr:fumarylacetoacetate hydrolase family protein [Acidimicrobiia bacterium]
MRLTTIRTADGTRAARVEGDRLVELAAADVGVVLGDGPAGLRDAASATGPEHDAAGADYAPVVPRPSKIICLGLNYETHIREMGHEPPDVPTLFAKYTVSLIGPRDPIVLPRASTSVDWEAELAFVIGTAVRHADAGAARAAIAGYTICNDVSMRDWQRRTPQWLQGKTFESSTPVGPVLVTPDEVDDARDLRVRCEIDGEVRQDARTSDLVFDPATVVQYVSTILTLVPGDLISTGTPGGVGAGMSPPVFLHPGQVVRTVIEGIGELVNECVAEP